MSSTNYSYTGKESLKQQSGHLNNNSNAELQLACIA